MLKQHQELAAQIAACRKTAMALYDKGCNVGAILDGLKTAADATQSRIRDYEAAARAPKPAPAPPPAPEAKSPAAKK